MAILGIDEVGRGPWAGPLVIGAVILPDQKPAWVDELTDSKKLTAKKREALNEIILKEAAATGLGWVSSRELDEIGLSNALKLATRRAVEEVRAKNVPFSEIIIDGTINFLAHRSNATSPFCQKPIFSLKKFLPPRLLPKSRVIIICMSSARSILVTDSKNTLVTAPPRTKKL